ncbi:MAG: ABC transporter transmembrane domain-containing protein [Enterococcus sp.]
MELNITLIFKRHKFFLFLLLGLVFVQMIISTIFPYITKYIIDDVLLSGSLVNLRPVIIFTTILIAIQIPVNICVSFSSSKWIQLLIYDLRQEISEKFLSSKLNVKKNGLFINTITSDCEIIGNQLLTILLNGIPNIFLIILYIIVLSQLNWRLTIGVLALVPIFVIVSGITSKKIYSLSIDLQKYRDGLTEFLNSYVHNKLPIDLYNLKNEEQNKFSNVSNQVKDTNVKTNTIMTFLSMISSLLIVIAPLLILFWGSAMVVKNELTLGALIAFNTYTAMLFSPLSKLLNTFPLFAQVKASIKRIGKLEFSDIGNPKGEYKQLPLSAGTSLLINVEAFNPCVEGVELFEKPINFSVFQGEMWRIVGPNGIGKSILLKCLIQYHESFRGTIWKNKDCKIVYVPQDNFLFQGTVHDNLVKGIKEYNQCLLQDLITLFSFDVRLDEKVTPFRITLSSGQQQKIKIIHALLCNPDVLILDETLANLDEGTILKFVEYLNNSNLTVIIVNHGSLEKYTQISECKVLELGSNI